MAHPEKIRALLPTLGRLAQRFWPYIRMHWTLLGVASLALFAEIGLRLLEPWPLKFIFDRVIAIYPDGARVGIPTLDRLDPVSLLMLCMLAIVVISGLRALTGYWNKIGFALVGNRVLAAVRHELYRHIQCLSLSFHTKARSGDLIVRVINDIGRVKEATVTTVLPLFASVLILIGMVGLMFWLNCKLALVALVPAPLFWLKTMRLSRRIHDASRKQRKRQGAMAATAAESIDAIKTVQTLSLEETFSRTFGSHNLKDLTEGVKAKRLAVALERTADILMAIAKALVLGYGARLVLADELSPGELLVFMSYFRRAYQPARNFARYSGRLAKAAAAGERVLDILERQPEVRDLPGAVCAPEFQGRVRFEGVSFAYESGRCVLKAIDLDVKPGQHVALVGPSGHGKSTLVSLLPRLYDPEHGRVTIDGQDIRHYTLASLRAQISVLLQDGLLFAATVRDNIAYGRPDATVEEIEAAAHLANAHDFIEALPQGYDTPLGERGITLSGGQRQRLAIARAAIRQAPILILDEPTLGLDDENERAVIEALFRLAQGRTTFLITHNLTLAGRADLILYVENGQLLERGRHDELMRVEGGYASLCQPKVGVGSVPATGAVS